MFLNDFFISKSNLTENSKKFVLYVNDSPATEHDDLISAKWEAEQLKNALPKSKLEIKKEICQDTPVLTLEDSAVEESAASYYHGDINADYLGLYINGDLKFKYETKDKAQAQQDATNVGNEHPSWHIEIRPIKKSQPKQKEQTNENRIYFDIPKSLEQPEYLRTEFQLRHDNKGWYLRESQENFKKLYLDANKAFSVK